MPWIDDDMRAEVQRRLRAAGFEGVTINHIHVALGPKATRENVTDQLVAFFIDADRRRKAGEPSRPPRSNKPATDIREFVRNLASACLT